MGDALQVETNSITTGSEQKLFLDEKDFRLIEGKKVLIVDDVISTGSTLEAMRKLMEMAGATIVEEVAIFTEGDSNEWGGIISLGHLPLFFE
jgi:adenine phosphoribosyltransferase